MGGIRCHFYKFCNSKKIGAKMTFQRKVLLSTYITIKKEPYKV